MKWDSPPPPTPHFIDGETDSMTHPCHKVVSDGSRMRVLFSVISKPPSTTSCSSTFWVGIVQFKEHSMV